MEKSEPKQVDRGQLLFNLGHFADTAASSLRGMDFTTIYQDPVLLQAYRDVEENLAEIQISIEKLERTYG